MRVIVISDTHEQHAKIKVPDGDVFVHAGDFTMIGESEWVEHFNEWLGKLPHKYKVVIAGNHDRCFDLKSLEGAPTHAMRYYGRNRLKSCTHYLLDDGCEIEGKHFWGSPYTPIFHSDYWKFHYDRAEGKERWSKIPEGLDMLITHGPAMCKGDRTLEGDFTGCFDLNEAILAKKPRHHVFGHIHEARGKGQNGDTTWYNVAAVDRLYRLREDPCVEINL